MNGEDEPEEKVVTSQHPSREKLMNLCNNCKTQHLCLPDWIEHKLECGIDYCTDYNPKGGQK